MKIWYLVFGLLVILLIVSSIDVSPKENMNVFVKDSKMVSYIIGKNDGGIKVFSGPVETKSDNARFFEYEEQDEELERCLKKMTRNWYRHSGNEDILGYDEEDDSMFKFELRERLKKGEKIC